jgi:hypothetical protein
LKNILAYYNTAGTFQVSSDDDALSALTAEFSAAETIFGNVPIDFHPVSGIHKTLLDSHIGANTIHGQRHKSSGPFLTSPLGANFDPRGDVVPQGRCCPPGAMLSPRGEICSLGMKFSVHPSILLNSRVFTPGGEQRGEHSP